ncbi:uncharacterized protein BDZ83DRAFT_650655 [Colletotrichum acutatum]|uniref:Uncharacterized protein n=1 Tax=Glomerella acutata TaxID=27357 RepID=A0AAD8XHA2_GLOAC|nr:uncharacterized protein BDZ83DRAFT_650655 [Colletotrichum acutatum]KAK1726256.1 hypothetical protein BDZ83DRAFT_650655 [Colletotrichum acutatum]
MTGRPIQLTDRTRYLPPPFSTGPRALLASTKAHWSLAAFVVASAWFDDARSSGAAASECRMLVRWRNGLRPINGRKCVMVFQPYAGWAVPVGVRSSSVLRNFAPSSAVTRPKISRWPSFA